MYVVHVRHTKKHILYILYIFSPVVIIPPSQLKCSTSSRSIVLRYVITGRLRTIFVARMPEVDAERQG